MPSTELLGNELGKTDDMTDGLAHLPKEWADRFTGPFLRFVRIEAMAGAVLFLCVLTALVLANTTWSAWYLSLWEMRIGLSLGDIEFSRSLKHWINDGLMTMFFFVVALELKRELVLGELRNPAIGGATVGRGTRRNDHSGRALFAPTRRGAGCERLGSGHVDRHRLRHRLPSGARPPRS